MQRQQRPRIRQVHFVRVPIAKKKKSYETQGTNAAVRCVRDMGARATWQMMMMIMVCCWWCCYCRCWLLSKILAFVLAQLSQSSTFGSAYCCDKQQLPPGFFLFTLTKHGREWEREREWKGKDREEWKKIHRFYMRIEAEFGSWCRCVFVRILITHTHTNIPAMDLRIIYSLRTGSRRRSSSYTNQPSPC